MKVGIYSVQNIQKSTLRHCSYDAVANMLSALCQSEWWKFITGGHNYDNQRT